MKKSKKVKITKNSTYYKWIEGVGANVKIYPCEHEKVDYKSLMRLNKKLEEELKKEENKVEELKQQLSNCLRMIKDSNKWHYKRLERYAKLYVGYKKKYQGLYKMRELYEREDEKNPFTEEEKAAAKDFEFKVNNVKLESGRVIDKYFLKKKHTKH